MLGIKKVKRMCRDFVRWVIAKKKFAKDKATYIQQTDTEEFEYKKEYEFPMIYDYKDQAGNVDPHYFYQDIKAARLVKEMNVNCVYDIGSRVDGFISHLLVLGIRVTMIDVRPLDCIIDGVDFVQGNAMQLSNIEDGTISVLSCLHALEHFGLGRYGDPIQYNGWRIALKKMIEKIKMGGVLLLSVPVSNNQRCCYNAHRVFDPFTIYNEISERAKLVSLFILSAGKWREYKNENNNVETWIRKVELGNYDLGLFVFEKTK